ncbi:PepSY domain-containing protein [Pseudomonadota bacterium]
MTTHSKKQSKRRYSLHQWHRYLGLFAGLFTLWVTLSGIALNHSAELAFDQQYAPSNWSLTGDSIKTPSIIAYRSADRWVSQLNDRIYIDTQEITVSNNPLIGAANLQQMQVVATVDSLWLFDNSGQLIEQIDWSLMLPANPTRLGIIQEKRLAMQVANDWYSADESMLSWQPIPRQTVHIVQSAQLPQIITQQLLDAYNGKSTTYEQLLLNLHTGRILGEYGVYLIDLIALILATLALSGFTVWLKRRQ